MPYNHKFEAGEYEFFIMGQLCKAKLKENNQWLKLSDHPKSGYVKINSLNYVRKIDSLVRHNGIIDWESTFQFAKYEINQKINKLFKN